MVNLFEYFDLSRNPFNIFLIFDLSFLQYLNCYLSIFNKTNFKENTFSPVKICVPNLTLPKVPSPSVLPKM